MEDWGASTGAIIGVAVACAFAVFFLKRNPAQTRTARVGRALLVMVVAGVAAAAAAVGASHVRGMLGRPTASEVDRAVEEARQWPLINVVVADHPEVEAQLRAAIEDDLKNPDREDKASRRMGLEIRQRYIVAALRKADDAAVLGAIGATEKLMLHLKATNEKLCADVGIYGIQDPSRLDTEGRTLFKDSLAMQEAAYRSGRTAATEPKTLSETGVAALLKQAGYTQADFDQLIKLTSLPAPEACAASVKLYDAPARLPPAEGAQAARWLLTASQ
jgi:hypothetical protein